MTEMQFILLGVLWVASILVAWSYLNVFKEGVRTLGNIEYEMNLLRARFQDWMLK